VTTNAINDLPEVPADKPPPGYTEFYGWYRGNFYGLKAKNSAELARLRAEGRWFDIYGREIARWRSDGSPNDNGGKLHWEEHPDPVYASRPLRGARELSIGLLVVWLLFLGGLYLLASGRIDPFATHCGQNGHECWTEQTVSAPPAPRTIIEEMRASAAKAHAPGQR
jgi:hypothetical protein